MGTPGTVGASGVAGPFAAMLAGVSIGMVEAAAGGALVRGRFLGGDASSLFDCGLGGLAGRPGGLDGTCSSAIASAGRSFLSLNLLAGFAEDSKGSDSC